MTTVYINPFQHSDVFHIQTGYLFCRSKQITGFYMKCSTIIKSVKCNKRLKWVKLLNTINASVEFVWICCSLRWMVFHWKWLRKIYELWNKLQFFLFEGWFFRKLMTATWKNSWILSFQDKFVNCIFLL